MFVHHAGRRLPKAAARRRQQRLFAPHFHGQAGENKHTQALSHLILGTHTHTHLFRFFLFFNPGGCCVAKNDNLPMHQMYVQSTDYELNLYSFTHLSPTRPSSCYFLQATSDDRHRSDGCGPDELPPLNFSAPRSKHLPHHSKILIYKTPKVITPRICHSIHPLNPPT